jgi:hypothetical protein
MGILLASLLAIVAVEYFLRIPFAARGRALVATARKSARVVQSRRISDHWKEVVLLAYAGRTARHALVLAAMLFGCIALVVFPAILLDWLFAPDPPTIDAFSSPVGLAAITLVSLLYIALRKRLGTR